MTKPVGLTADVDGGRMVEQAIQKCYGERCVRKDWEQNNRHFGRYANRTRGKRKSCHSPRRQTDEEREGRAPLHCRRTWAELLRLVFEVKLVCPRCGTDMKIISFITEREPIRKILAHLKEKGIDARAGPFEDCAA
jgi:hypothetical protein